VTQLCKDVSVLIVVFNPLEPTG